MLKIGVIGAGHLGKIHLKVIKEIDSLELVGFYDTDPEQSARAQSETGARAFGSMAELMEECDAVDIVCPTIHHFECASEALKKFKHVFIEKPVTSTEDEAKELMALAGEANVKVQVGHVERFNPAFIAARPYFNQPMFVESHRLAQFNPRGTDVSVVLDLMIHDIDIILSTIKSNIKRISASGVAVVSDTPDIANARLEFDNGCVANLTASRMSFKRMRKMRFFQRDAYISIDFLEKSTEIVKISKVEGQPDPLSAVIDLGAKGMKSISFEKPDVEKMNSIEHELRTFTDAILNNTNTAVPLEDGCAALKVAHQVIEKLKVTSNILA